MTADDIQSLLQAAGGDDLLAVDNAAFIQDVLRVSEGDPFYVHFLVEDLLNGRIQPENINQQPTGLDEYLRAWWEQVASAARSEQDIRDVLGSLAVALGRLSRNDLVEMFPDLGWALDGVLSELRRFVIGNEREDYALSHPRFADYVRRRIGPRALQAYTDTLLTYCARWKEHLSPYALRYFTTHLSESGRVEELLALVDVPFLQAKIQRFRSYAGVLQDVRNAVKGAVAAGHHVKMLGLALAHAGLQTKVLQLATSDVIPLYAKFGEPERALDLADTIRDEVQRAKTLIAIAEQMLLSDAEQARRIVRAVLANWRPYYLAAYKGIELGTILRRVLTILPEELITFFEGLEDPSPIHSLGNSTYLTYEAVDQGMPHLEANLQERLRRALARALTLPADDEQSTLDLRFLLVRLEPDPDTAQTFADSDVARIIVQAKRDQQEQPDGQLSTNTLGQMVLVLTERHPFLRERLPYNEKWVLLYHVAAPHAAQIIAIINRLNLSDKGVYLRLDLALALMVQLGDVQNAQELLFEAIRLNREEPQLHFGEEPSFSYGSLDELLKLLIEGLARVDISNALNFLDLPEVAAIASKYRPNAADAIRAVIRTNPEAGLRAAGALLRSDRDIAMIAEELARIEFERALLMWRQLDPSKVDKPNALIKLLYNAPKSSQSHAHKILEEEFSPELHYQLYKVPLLLDISIRMTEKEPEQAKAVAEQAVDQIWTHFEREGWSRPERELFLARVIPAFAVCSNFTQKWAQRTLSLLRMVTDDFGIRSVAAADILLLLVNDHQKPELAEILALESTRKHGRADKAEVAESKLARNAKQRIREHRPINATIAQLHNIVVNEHSWGRTHLGQFAASIIDYVELSNTMETARLLGLYLLHKAEWGQPEWYPDLVAGLLADKGVCIYKDSVSYFLTGIKDDETRALALTELYGRLPDAALPELHSVESDILQAIALVRRARNQPDSDEKQWLLLHAFSAAKQSQQDPLNPFTMDLLLEFLREACKCAPEQVRRFARELIVSVLSSSHHWIAYRLYELGDCGYQFSTGETTAIEYLVDKQISSLENPIYNGQPLSEHEAHRLAAKYLPAIARSVMTMDKERGLQLLERAASNAASVLEVVTRCSLQVGILRVLLSVDDVTLWQNAVSRSLDFGNSIFHTFDRVGRRLLEIEQDDSSVPFRLLKEIEWAEELMKL